LKRSLACFVNVMVSDFGRPPLFLGGGASGREGASARSSVMARTQLRARGNYSALCSSGRSQRHVVPFKEPF
jgi:hypothetical protein